MSAIDKQGLERAAKVAQVIAEHPGLPIKVLVPSMPSDYDTYWCDATGARVEWLLYPDEVQGSAMKSDERRYVGLSYGRIYNDEDDAAEDVAEWLFKRWFDLARDHGMKYGWDDESADDVLTEFCGMLARELVADMPWHECIVIDCY